MSDAPTSAISPLLIIIVIFVVVIIFFTLGSETQDQILGIFDQAFFGEEKDKASAELATVESQKALLENIHLCDPSEKYNPTGESACFCLTESFGNINKKNKVAIQNVLSEDKVIITSLGSGGEPLSQETQKYNLGLFAVVKDADKRSLVCLYPQSFFIQGVEEEDEHGGEVNHWYVIWEEDLPSKSFLDSLDKRWETGDDASANDYYYGFYREKALNADYAKELRTAPIIYRTSAEYYCLLTDLVEEDIDSKELTSNILIENIPVEIGSIEGFIEPSTDFSDVIDFFTDDSKYCTKEQDNS